MRIDPGNGAVLARLSDESPLLIEKHIGEGRALVFGSTLDNVANDLPVHASFVPFIERIAAYLSGPVSGTPSLPVGSTVVLRTERERAAPVMVLDPTGSRAIDLKQSLGAVSYSFSREGYWETQNAAGLRQLFAVNADRKESDLARVSDEMLALWMGSGGHVGSNQGATPGEPVKIPLWPYFLAGLLALAAAESIVADRLQPASEAKEQLARREAA